MGFEPTISSLTSWHVNRYTTGPPMQCPQAPARPPKGHLILYWAKKGVNVGSSGRAVVGAGANYLYNSIRLIGDKGVLLPRRYRPPSRRRRSKKERLQPEPAAPRDAGPRDAAPAAPVSPPPPVSAPVTVREDRSDRGRQIGRDHSYVLGDLRRIALIVAFIVGGLVITAILR
jgi:hypothetical protein